MPKSGVLTQQPIYIYAHMNIIHDAQGKKYPLVISYIAIENCHL
jgi:hypothetical protein